MEWIRILVIIGVISFITAQSEILLSRLGLDEFETFSYSRWGLRAMSLSSIQQTQQVDTLYVTSEEFQSNGIFFAFKAFWLSQRPLNVQIWRPGQGGSKNSPTQSFNFVSDVDIVPEQINTTHTVYIVSSLDQKCIRVKKGDRIGFPIKTGSNSSFTVSYNEALEASNIFVATGESAMVGNTSDHVSVNFSSIIFPYKMNFIAYLFVDNAQSNEVTAECPKNLLVESITTTTPAFIQGDMGPTGDIGETGNTGIMGPIGATGLPGPHGLQGPKGAAGVKGTAGATGPPGSTGARGPDGSVGSTGEVGDTGATGWQGSTGPRGPDGISGLLIFVNSTDDEVAGNPSRFSALLGDVAAALADDSKWKSEPFMIGLLIWFSLLSLLVIIFIIVLISMCYKFQDKKKKRSRKSTIQDCWNTFATSDASELEFGKDITVSTIDCPTVNPDDGDTTLENSFENLKSLKEETFKELTNETIPMY